MPSTEITFYPDGPCVVRGPVRLVDERDNEIENRRKAIALCRCGRSRLMPFCDATHRAAGFASNDQVDHSVGATSGGVGPVREASPGPGHPLPG